MLSLSVAEVRQGYVIVAYYTKGLGYSLLIVLHTDHKPLYFGWSSLLKLPFFLTNTRKIL